MSKENSNSVVKKSLTRLSIHLTNEELEAIESFLNKESREIDKTDMSWTVKNLLFELAGLDRPLNKKEHNKKLSRERYWANKN